MTISRRDFVKKAGLMAAGTAAAGNLAAQGIGEKTVPPGVTPANMSPAPSQVGPSPPPGDMKHGMMGQQPLTDVGFPRYEKGRKYSPPPPLMGKQMGTVNTLSVPPLGYEMDGDVKVFRLIAQPVWQQLTDGKKDRLVLQSMKPHMTEYAKMVYMNEEPRYILGWGFNGNVPGPTIECTEGDRIRVHVKNELPEPTSVHWHGIELPNREDGASPETAPPIPPGGEYVYEYTFYQNGTFLYHSGFNTMKQDSMGLGGLLVVHPIEGYDPPIDRDFALLHQTWVLHPFNPNPDLTRMDFNWITFNGKVAPSIDIMDVNQFERVRIRQGNLSMMHHPIHFHGYSFEIVGTAGGPIPPSARWPDSTVIVPAGDSRDVEFFAWNPGIWRFHCHLLHHIMNGMDDMPMGYMSKGGMFTLLNVSQQDPDWEWHHPRQDEIEEIKARKRGERA